MAKTLQFNDDARKALERGVNVLGYGTAAAAARHQDIPAGAVVTAKGRVAVELAGKGSVEYTLAIPGEHMVLNSAAALLAGALVGADPQQLAAGLSDFTGVRRRFELKGEVTAGKYAGVRVYDDYAHHPTEVAAVLKAAREKAAAEGAGARVVVCFQPHLYSRTQEFAAQFADALSLADACVVLGIFGAREAPVEGVSSRLITERMRPDTEVRLEPDFSAAPATVASLTQAGDLVFTMGAGSVTLLGDEILAALSDPEAAAVEPAGGEG